MLSRQITVRELYVFSVCLEFIYPFCGISCIAVIYYVRDRNIGVFQIFIYNDGPMERPSNTGAADVFL